MVFDTFFVEPMTEVINIAMNLVIILIIWYGLKLILRVASKGTNH